MEVAVWLTSKCPFHFTLVLSISLLSSTLGIKTGVMVELFMIFLNPSMQMLEYNEIGNSHLMDAA
jgi:hypothetical protein